MNTYTFCYVAWNNHPFFVITMESNADEIVGMAVLGYHVLRNLSSSSVSMKSTKVLIFATKSHSFDYTSLQRDTLVALLFILESAMMTFSQPPVSQ